MHSSLQCDLITPWMVSQDEQCEAASLGDPIKHELMRAHVMQVIHECPAWFGALLKAADAQVLAMQSAFFIALPADRSDWIEIPELSARLRLLPWVDDDETAH
jgi:hypothetical protein